MDRRCSGAIVAQQRKVTRRWDRAFQVMIGVGLSLCVSTAVEAQSNVRISGYGNMHYMKEEHGGTIALDSQLGEGLTVTLTLPKNVVR